MNITKILKSKGIRLKAINEELVDHFSSQYEVLITQGHSKEEAVSIIIKDIESIDSTSIQKNYFSLYYKNYLIMSFTLILASIFILFQSHQIIEPPSLSPVENPELSITSGFGMRMHPVKKIKKLHKGIDIKAKLGTTVVATSAGVVADCGYDKLNGYYIEIKHDDTYTTRYHHLSKIEIKKDQKVELGSKIGEIGSTGMSTGPHLHYEVLKDGENVDPAKFLKV